MKKSILQKYAKLIARSGVNVKKGDLVVIRASVDQPEFIKMITEECYRAGAEKVIVEFSYLPIKKAHLRYRSLKTMSHLEDWEIQKLAYVSEKLPAMIYIESDDPSGLTGINQEKLAKAEEALYKVEKPYYDKMNNKYKWCIAAVPGEKWAKKVFPELRKSAAIEKLWEMILYTSRADGENPIEDWKNHDKNLKSKCNYLNSLGITELKYSSSNGTDFTVGFIPDSLFISGSDKTISGESYNANIPSEEVFISPMRGKAEGKVVSTRPLSYHGELIEDFWMVFKDGKVVDSHAEKNDALLKKMIGMDKGSAYLGECSLVPYDSPIRKSGITFYNTLFDENACCHLALGEGFSNCLKNYENYTLEECREKGINESIIHEDFMIGSPDLCIDAICSDGKTVAIFRNGNWAF